MPAFIRTLSALAGALLCGLTAFLFTSVAAAAPITVNLRVEGATKTLLEGPVSVEAIPAPPGIATKSSAGSHPCDVKDNGGNGGFGAAAATPTAALYDAALAQQLPFDATWSGGQLNDFEVSQVGEDVSNSNENGEFWGYAVDYATAEVGGCQIRLAPGNEVLWAYNFFGLAHLLKLSGPVSVNAGAPFTVHVTDGQTGQPVAGAAIGQFASGVTATNASSPLTDANGNATVTLTQAGADTLKATQKESVRSNGLAVCVHNGNDGTCGTTIPPRAEPGIVLPPFPPPAPDVVHAGGAENGHTYSRHGAPRLLTGRIDVPAGGTLREVRFSLERVRHGHCFAFNGRRGAFVRARCDTQHFFKVAQTTSFSYLLPSRLRPGRYVYVVEAMSDGGANVKPSSGVSRVVFYVK
jgi:hypothetical protein